MDIYEKYKEHFDTSDLITGDYILRGSLSEIISDAANIDLIISVIKKTYNELCKKTVENLLNEGTEFEYSALYYPRYKMIKVTEIETDKETYYILVLTAFDTYLSVSISKP